jgi:CRISPR/Cas system CSM-associated protein Csm4 (group 5 of RAMP superfamily)
LLSEEICELEKKKIVYSDITNFFPYLKNIEDQVLDLESICDFQVNMDEDKDSDNELDSAIFEKSRAIRQFSISDHNVDCTSVL